MDGIDNIVKLILEESDREHGDMVVRIHAVEMKVGHKLIEIIEQVREKERLFKAQYKAEKQKDE